MPGFSVVVPVKRLELAKSRLAVPRRDLVALAMALDTVAAASRVPAVNRIVVVTDDARVRAAAARLGCVVLPDLPAAGLNAALTHGVAWARRQASADSVAALAADLPALRPAELAAALAATASAATAVVADHVGVGTTLYMVSEATEFEPKFGPGSLAAYVAAGTTALTLPLPGLRQDVDTIADLRVAASFGLGEFTAAAVQPDRMSG